MAITYVYHRSEHVLAVDLLHEGTCGVIGYGQGCWAAQLSHMRCSFVMRPGAWFARLVHAAR